jgi:hypothetical protein
MTNEARFDAAPPAETAKPRRRWRRRIVVGFVVLFVGVLAAYGIWRHRALAARDAEIAKIRAAGEPVWFADLRPEPLDPKEDGTPLLLQAFAVMQPLPDALVDEMRELREPPDENEEVEDAAFEFDGDKVDADEFDGDKVDADEFDGDEIPEDGEGELAPNGSPRDAMPQEHADETIEGALPPIKPLPRTFEFREAQLVGELRPHVEANREFYDLLEQALEKGRFQFACDYEVPVPFLQERPERDSCGDAVKLLQARWRCQLRDADYAAAGASCEQMLRLVEKTVSPSDSLVFMLFRIVWVNGAVEAVSETVARSGFDPALRLRLDDALVGFDATVRLRPALVAERAEALTALENLMQHGNEGQPFVSSGILQGLFRPVIWSNQASYLEYMATYIEFADRYDADAVAAISELETRLEARARNPLLRVLRFGQNLLPDVEFIGDNFRATRDRLRAARVGLRVDAFHREHGRLPKSLDEVKSAELPEIPSDLAGEKPLAYVVDKNAFTICPAAYVEIERKRLAERVERRDAEPKPPAAEPDDPVGAFFGLAEEDDTTLDEEMRTGAFQVVYPRTGKVDPLGRADP